MGSGASQARYEPMAESTTAASTPVAASEKARRERLMAKALAACGWSDLLAPARLRLAANDIGNEAMRAIKTAASTSLELELCQGATIWGSRDPTSKSLSPENSRRGSTAMPPSPGNSGRYSQVR